MADAPPDWLLSKKLQLLSAIVASQSHELKNVLATVNEYTGLLSDLSQISEQVSGEKVRRVCSKISDQIGRGERLVGRLNRFSHSVTEPGEAVDVQGVLNQICDLCDRFAKLKRVKLERQLSAQPISRVLDQVAFQYAVYTAVDLALEHPVEGVVTVKLTGGGDAGCRVAIEGGAALHGETGSEHAQALGRVMALLGGALQWEAAGGTSRAVLAFP